jgi:uroporphyrinogen-III synthase
MSFMSDTIHGLFQTPANKAFIAKLEARGLAVLALPQVEVSALEFTLAEPLDSFDWMVFRDIYSADFFLTGIGEVYALDELRVCTYGEAVADRLRFSQVHADIIPARIAAEEILSQIAAYDTIAGKRFLIPREKHAAAELASLLKNKNGEVVELPVYEAHKPSELAKWRSLLLGGAIDNFIFTSPQDVYDLCLFAEPGEINAALQALDEQTLRALQEFGLPAELWRF